jgi:Rps23 Pro-64 3,4-dihydroxylase Tpa1-like proline 4-hydroxylase
MINNDLDFEGYRIDLAKQTRVQIPDFLQLPAAERLRSCLQNEVPWSLAERSDGTPKTIAADDYAVMDSQARAAILQKAYVRAKTEFQFCYESYMMVKAAKEGRDPGLILHAILEFLNSEEFIGFARWLANDPRISHASAQATRYRPGHFLTRHQDKEKNEDRAYAYVINLTKNWQADWGGLLQFENDQGDVTQTFVPHWNSLSLFKVPQSHTVSLVAPYATEDRLAITGWLLRPM